MSDTRAEFPAPAIFDQAVESIRAAVSRPELVVTEIQAPGKLAPHAFALAADLASQRHAPDAELGTGRFVLLYDPSMPDAWGGVFRVVCFAQAPLETDIGLDPFVADVAWSWLVDALDDRGARYIAASGTATKIISTGYGELAAQGDGAQLEIRASWTPLDEAFGEHLRAWCDLLCTTAGLPPVSPGVVQLPVRRRSSRR